jgi:alpha-amylase
MKQITFLLGIHNHQPVGNFEWVFEDALKLCYEPFLNVLSQHPNVRVSLHHTGPLLEWIEKNKPSYFDKLDSLLERNQIELMGGAFYEPLISTLPEEDAIGQIEMMNQYLSKKFNQKAQGMWLAERVWEPQLASIVKQAGMQYTLVDDTHFYYAGLHEQDMYGYYITEDKGKTLAIFPINKHLRYLVPFNTPEKSIEFLGSIATDHEGRGVTLGDDGEKFGLWPGTHRWVFEERYLDRLFSLLEENAHWIKMITFSEYIQRFKPMDRIYLPTASYEEMMEWSLPTQTQKTYDTILNDLKNKGQYEFLRPFIRGGFWRNFFSKYSESNLMHKKMIYVSDLISKMPKSKEKETAKKELWKGQCNCPYWHGLFGGLYLNYLRHANFSHLIAAENIALNQHHDHKELIRMDRIDYNCDGKDEIIINTKDLNVYLQPGYGGSISELDYRLKNFNLTNVLTRREESYHNKIAQAQKTQSNDGQPKSIHDLTTVKEEGLDRLLFYDWYTRYSLLDHFFKLNTSFDEFYSCRYQEEGDFVNQEYHVENIYKKEGALAITLKRQGHLFRDGQSPYPVTIDKKMIFSKNNQISFNYVISSLHPEVFETWFGVEFNLTLLSGNDKKRYYLFNSKTSPHTLLGSKGEKLQCQSIEMVNEEDEFSIKIDLSQNSALWYFPLETISQSESGVEKTYQGSCICPFWKIQLAPNQPFKVNLELSVNS